MARLATPELPGGWARAPLLAAVVFCEFLALTLTHVMAGQDRQ